MADVKAVEIKINSDVLAALERAKIVIQNYQADIRAAKEHFNVDLVGMGFCQGHVYTNAIYAINKIAYGEAQAKLAVGTPSQIAASYSNGVSHGHHHSRLPPSN